MTSHAESTLFPYTTLFRSPEQRQVLIAELDRKKEVTFDRIRRLLKMPENVKFNLERGGEKRLRGNETNAILAKVFGDRKSTRLNSSHVRTSYAVLCLKKKIPAADRRGAGRRQVRVSYPARLHLLRHGVRRRSRGIQRDRPQAAEGQAKRRTMRA